MTKTALKMELYQAIDSIEDEKFLTAIHTILSQKLQEYSNSLNSEQEAEIEKRIAAFKSGESKTHTWHQAKKIIRSRLNK